MRREIADVLVRRRRRAAEVEQHEPLDDREADRLAAPMQAGSKSSSPSVNGAVRSDAVEAVGPRVVRALHAPHAALGLLDEARAAVAADVVERAREPVVVGNDEDAVGADLDHQELAALAHLVDVAGADPAAAEAASRAPTGARPGR